MKEPLAGNWEDGLARPHRLGRSLNRGLPVRGDVSSRILRFWWCESVAAKMTIRGLKYMAKALLAGALAAPLAMLLGSTSRCETRMPLSGAGAASYRFGSLEMIG